MTDSPRRGRPLLESRVGTRVVATLGAAASIVAALTVGTQATLAVAAPAGDASSAAASPLSPAARAAGSGGAAVPASFVANVGQAPAGVAFVGDDAAMSLGPTDFVVTVPQAAAGTSARGMGGRSRPPASSTGSSSSSIPQMPTALAPKAAAPATPATPPLAVAMHLVGANASATAFTADPLPGKVNYLLGNDRSKWRTGLATFATVGWHSVYPGIDVSYGGGKGQVEYTFTVAAGADPAAIRLSFGPNVSKVALDADGSLSLTTPAGVVRQAAPQLSQGSGASITPVGGAFQLLPAGQVGFSVGAYDHTLPLVIDPTIAYSTYLGDAVNGGDNGTAIAVDPTGAAYVTGTTPSTQFPTTAGSFQPSSPPLSPTPASPPAS